MPLTQIGKCKFDVLNKVKSATTLSKSNTLEQMRARQNSSSLNTKIVVNKEKGQISPWRQQENKARQISGKTDIACPPRYVHMLFSSYLRFLFCLIDEIDKKFTSNQSFRLRFFVPVSQLLCKALAMCRLSRFVSHVFDTF